MPKKKDGLALMILSGGKKKPKDDADDKKALLAACGTFASSMGVELSSEQEEAACEALSYLYGLPREPRKRQRRILIKGGRNSPPVSLEGSSA